MKLYARALLHAGYWTLYLLVVGLVLLMLQVPHRAGAPLPRLGSAWPLVLLSVAPAAIAFYAAYGFLFSRFLARRRVTALLVSTGAMTMVAAGAGLGLAAVLFGIDQPAFASATETTALATLLAGIAAVHAAAALVMRGFVSWYDEIQVKEELARKNHAAELALVRSKLDPHFLFNTLNNIDVLIGRNPADASRYLNQLSDIMRFVLYEARGETVPLSEELSYITKYIALERIRSRNAACVTYDVAGDPSGLSVAPMTFIPFIENAFKHASLKTDGAIASRVSIDGRRIEFECRNRCPFDSPRSLRAGDARYRGIGADLIRRRLELLYPNRHTLRVDTAGHMYSVHLTIDAL